MGVELRKLVRQIGGNDMKLVAGEKGLSQVVEWIHMVDTVEISGFLEGGEFVFTTGIGICPEMTIVDLVKNVVSMGAVGIAINVGPYIESIPKEVIEYANEHNFAVFEVPWRVHMAQIIRQFSYTITMSMQRAIELASAFKNAIYLPQQEELYVPVMLQKGYKLKADYVVAVIDVSDAVFDEETLTYKPILEQRLEIFMQNFERTIKNKGKSPVMFIDNSRIITIIDGVSDEETAELMNSVITNSEKIRGKNEAVFIGVGPVATGVKELRNSCRLAEKTMKYNKIRAVEGEVLQYSSLGVEKIIMNIESKGVINAFYKESIEPLDEYDTINRSNLVEILETYLANNGSVNETADQLFVHRNTVNYKLKKIESILNVNISEFAVRNKLSMGLLAAKMRDF